MPLRAEYNGKDVLSFEFTSQEWHDFKSAYKSNTLIMPCCKTDAIPKTSNKGTHFFSHAVKGNCESEAESQEHLFVKTIIAKAAKEAGWVTYTEWPGETDDGDKWVADIYCTKGNAKIVFEVQLSYQSLSELKHRQKRYKKSGVRCAWFISSEKFKIGYIKHSKDTPCFYLSKISLNTIPIINEFKVDLQLFVKGMLEGKLTWDVKTIIIPEITEAEEHDILVYEDNCWGCNKVIKQIYGWSVDVYHDQAKTVPNASNILEKIKEFAPNDELKKAGVNTIGRVDYIKGKKVNFPYVNVCSYCGAVQNNYYLMEKLKNKLDSEFDSVTIINKKTVTPQKEKKISKWLFNI